MKKKNEDAKVLKMVIDNLNSEASKNRNEIKGADKIFKTKEKELYNLEKKTQNQQETIQRLKADLAKIKSEKVKSEKEHPYS